MKGRRIASRAFWFALVLALGMQTEALSESECLGDVDGDGVVDGSDVAVVAGELGVTMCHSSDYVDPLTGMEFIYVPPGTFAMGDVYGDSDSDEQPVHVVTITAGFLIGRYEVTQAQWEAVAGSNPSHFVPDNGYFDCPDCPVERVSWDDVQGFIAQLNALTGRTYRLPTEAEWEYAARNGGTCAKWAGTWSEAELEDYAWYSGNSNSSTHPVGQKLPNGLGFYDLSGNVWEWVQDCWNDSYGGAPADGSAWFSGDCSQRVIRGGSLLDDPGHVRSAGRYWNSTDGGYFDGGFRLARDLE